MNNFKQTTLANINIVRSLSSNLGGGFKKSLGQHFLINQNSLLRFIKILDLNDEDTVIEIGPGIGVVTYTLCQMAKRVILIEIDKSKEEALRKTLENFNNYEIIWADASNFDFSSIKEKNIKIISSLPYNVGKKIIYNILNSSVDWEKAAFILQKEVVEDYSSIVPDAKFLGIFLQIYADVEMRFKIPPEHFVPKPQVQSAVLYLKKHTKYDHLDKKSFAKFIKQGFIQPRKTILNNLKALNITKEQLESLNLNPALRPSQVKLEDWERIYSKIK